MLSRNLTESEKRQRQINTLKIFNDNVSEIKEGKEYLVKFNAAETELNLYVLLSESFPNEKPVFVISPVVAHDWVNSEGEITSAPGLLNYTVHSDLGRIVQAVIREFGRNPPPLLTDQIRNLSNNSSPSIPIRESDAMGRLSPSYQYSNVPHFASPTHSSFMNNIPHTSSSLFPELSHLSIQQLKYINENANRQEQLIFDLPQVKDLNSSVDTLLGQVEEITDLNLSVEESIEDLRKDIETRLEEVTKLVFENERLNVNYQSLSEKYSPRNIKQLLRVAAEKANADGDRIAESFLQGDLEVDKFVSMYLQAKTLGQIRKTKEEKLSHQLESLDKASYSFN